MLEEPDIFALNTAYVRLQTSPNLEVISLLEDLANRGSLMSKLYLAWAYEKGKGIPVDDNKAELWYRKAINENSSLATYYLGHFYLKKDNFTEAKEFFQIGTSMNYSPAIYCLGCLFLEGKGCEKNPNEALNLFSKASHMGHVFAKRSLAGMYLTGQYGIANFFRGIGMFFFALKDLLAIRSKDPESDLLRA
jgi:TPR repeat protein